MACPRATHSGVAEVRRRRRGARDGRAHWKEEQYAFSLLTVAIVERNVAEAERWIEQLQKDGIYLPDLYTDELIAEGLQSDEFNSLRKKFPELKAALEEKKE